ncbi:MAG: BamA/TamA family outer membrane protein [Myxococcales bacterium]|nr:BamA/TamA family outer membrane protein [Myxococcales bacterium]
MLFALTALGLSLVSANAAQAQLLVHPRRPSQTNVRYADFDWRYVDILRKERLDLDIEWQSGPRFHLSPFRPPSSGATWAWPGLEQAPHGPAAATTPEKADDGETARAAAETTAPTTADKAKTPSEPGGAESDTPSYEGSPSEDRGGKLAAAGGIRLYFYERERDIAERAAASIDKSYRYLATVFDYAPKRTFGYFLYSSYIEFLQTDLFPVQEGVLGVTSPMSLEVSLPYFGDHRLFEDVSTHELAHEFTIQKLLTVAERAGTPGPPWRQIPLWFIEGLAEYYAKHGIDREAEMLVRDLIVNPTAEGRVLGDFFDERLQSGMWIYKGGQVRCAFLEETYGKGTIQRIIEETPRLLQNRGEGGVGDFSSLVARVTGDRPRLLSARFERWIKRRAFQSFLDSDQDRTDMVVITAVEGHVQALAAAPNGHVLLYRSIDLETGQNTLHLMDRHDPAHGLEVVRDGRPGVETLHPVAGRNFDVGDSALVFVAESEGRDVIYHQRFDHDVDVIACGERGKSASRVCGFEVELGLRRRRELSFERHRLLTIDAVALSPDGRGVAFIGLTEDGQKDLFMLPDVRDPGGSIYRLTRDVHAERELSWGPRGIIYTSDATGHGRYNLFLVDPTRPGRLQRLTTDAQDHFDPQMLPNGNVVFTTYDDAGANIYEVRDGKLLQKTEVTTGLFDVAPGPDGSLWALHHQGGRRLPIRIPEQHLLRREPMEQTPDEGAPAMPRTPLLVDRDYNPLDISNWQPGALFLLAGFSGSAVFGSLVATASDRLRDHGLILGASVFGDFRRIDAELTYVNQEQRVIWGAGLFHDVSARIDETFVRRYGDDYDFSSYQRFFGAQGLARYPFSRFFYAQASLAAGGIDYFVTDRLADQLSEPGKADGVPDDLLTPWREHNAGTRFQIEQTATLGYSTIGYHRSTGPYRGHSLLLTHTAGIQPFDQVSYRQLRFDAEQYLPIYGASNLLVRGALGNTTGDERAPQFFLSSFHTLRGVPFGDVDFLLGRQFFHSTIELQFPLLTLSDYPLIDIEGVLASDFGGVGDNFTDLWDHRVFDLVFGFNFGFAPLVLRLHFAQPIDTGAPPALPNGGELTFNFSLAWRYR